MTRPRTIITPHTKVGELLDEFPELEETLIALATPFSKLRNPILRRTVAKITTLSQAARVGGLPVGELVRKLRAAAGQPEYRDESALSGDEPAAPEPVWLDRSRVVATLDARPIIEQGDQPMGRVMQELSRLEPGDVYELITPFEPAPLIDLARGKGFVAWGESRGRDEYRTCFRKS